MARRERQAMDGRQRPDTECIFSAFSSPGKDELYQQRSSSASPDSIGFNIYSRQSSFESPRKERDLDISRESVSCDSDYGTMHSGKSTVRQKRQIWEIFNQWSTDFSMMHGQPVVNKTIKLKQPNRVYSMSDMIDIRQRKFENTISGKLSKLPSHAVVEQLDIAQNRFLWHLNEDTVKYVKKCQDWLSFQRKIQTHDIYTHDNRSHSRRRPKNQDSLLIELREDRKTKTVSNAHLCYVEKTLVQALEYKKNPASFILPVGPTGVSDTKYLFNVAHRPNHHEQAYRKYEQSPKPQRHERQAMINRYNADSLEN